MASAATKGPSPAPESVNQSSPRKRRRRAPTTGAADDCFTCREREMKCDRRRPYCTQCLDMKATCSGYKTQLTWGVGVASRGKLRGLSLPVAKSKLAGPMTTTAGVTKRKASTASSTGSAPKTPSTPASTSQPTSAPPPRQMPPTPMSQPQSATSIHYSFVGVDPQAPHAPTQSAPPFQTTFEWSPQQKFTPSAMREQPMPRSAMRDGVHKPARRSSMQPLHVETARPHHYHSGPPTSNMSATFSPHPYDPHLDYSPISAEWTPRTAHPSAYPSKYATYPTPEMTRPDLHQHGMMDPSFHSMQPPPTQLLRSWPSQTSSSSSGSDPSRHSDSPDGFFPQQGIVQPADMLLAQQQVARYPHNPFTNVPEYMFDSINEEEIEEIDTNSTMGTLSSGLSDFQRFVQHQGVGSTPELRYLINYYLEVLTPVIIAFDGPKNPYRYHILRLASQSEGLQHAIAALSASNLRMRREHNTVADTRRLLSSSTNCDHDASVRRSSEAHNRLNDEVSEMPDFTQPGMPTKRELYHKGESVRALNAHLADPARRSDDTILAILLMICLYHMCETGVARFRTQFAGVKKILAMRGQPGTLVQSKDTSWCITMFKWFDAMTATVNDREGQFHDDPNSNPFAEFDAEPEEWGLENLAGCDSRLFKIVSKLGRLNVLSQGKPVSSTGASNHSSAFPTDAPTGIPLPGAPAPYLRPDLRVDTAGWATLLPSDPSTRPDPRAQFWTEWTLIRQELQAWSFSPDTLPTPMRTAAYTSVHTLQKSPTSDPNSNAFGSVDLQTISDPSILDVRNISESFRYAALLYTSRLAYPSLPSAAAEFQSIVHTALSYLALVKSDVCLLWPLFIVGTECVIDDQRRMIRGRCLDIQKDSGFFNNIKCLELLEVIWKRAETEGFAGGQMDGGGGGQSPYGGLGVKREREDDGVGAGLGGVGGGVSGDGVQGEAFKWRRHMQSADGETMVI